MEEKMVKIPFDVELAKKIQAEEHPGSVITREGKDVRILCFDAKNDYPIVALLEEEDREERIHSYKDKGRFYNEDSGSNHDLFLQVPEWTQYKEGDVLVSEMGVTFIFAYVKYDRIYAYASLLTEFNRLYTDVIHCVDYRSTFRGYATEDEKQKLIDALKRSNDERAKEYLRRFFGIKPECKFKPFQQVLVRGMKGDRWEATFFSCYDDSAQFAPYHTMGGSRCGQCIPYNEQTKHLLGTTDEWEEE